MDSGTSLEFTVQLNKVLRTAKRAHCGENRHRGNGDYWRTGLPVLPDPHNRSPSVRRCVGPTAY